MTAAEPKPRPKSDQQPQAEGDRVPEDKTGRSGIPRLPLLYVTEGYGPKPDD